MPSTLDFPPPSDLFGAATGGGVGSEYPEISSLRALEHYSTTDKR